MDSPRSLSAEANICSEDAEYSKTTRYIVSSKSCAPVLLNNMGARYILEGRYSDAMQCLSRALKFSKKAMADGRRWRHANASARPDAGRGTFAFSRNERPTETRTRSAANHHHQLNGGHTVSSPEDDTVVAEGDQPARRSDFDDRALVPTVSIEEGTQGIGAHHRIVAQATVRTMVRAHPTDESCAVSTSHLELKSSSGVTKSPDGRERTHFLHPATALDVSGPSYVYSEPVMLDPERKLCHRHRSCVMRITVTIIFNMALAHHLRGRSMIATGNVSPPTRSAEEINELNEMGRSELRRASALYSLSCRIQVKEGVLIDEILSMAHLNNLGWIHATLGNTQSSVLVFERLLSNLMLYTQLARSRTSRCSGTKRRLSGFRRNATQFILGKLVLASAA